MNTTNVKNLVTDGLFELRQYPLGMAQRPGRNGGFIKPRRLTIAAGGMIFAHNKVLLDRSDVSDLWSIPGGVVQFTESAEETVVRELKEELNLTVEVIDHQPYVFYFELEAEEFLEEIYLLHFLVKVHDSVKIVMGGDIVDYRWDSIGSHFRDCYPNVKPAVDYFMQI